MVDDDKKTEKLKGWLTLAAILAVLVVLYFAVPRLLNRVAVNDLQGAQTHVASGVVLNLQIIPGNPGGGDSWNAVDLSFDGRKVFYSLPRTTRWSPLPKEPVTVHYRVGRSGVVQIDQVEPADDKPTFGPIR